MDIFNQTLEVINQPSVKVSVINYKIATNRIIKDSNMQENKKELKLVEQQGISNPSSLYEAIDYSTVSTFQLHKTKAF